jgi:type I restriction-modification system DNA methylase subunit
MTKLADTKEEIENIKKNCLIGVEQQPNMYALGVSNMILRGDGKANIYQASCFDEPTVKALKEHKCNIGMINPPYSQSEYDLHELSFINHMLNCLDVGATGIAIIPIPCVLGNSDWKEELLKNHRLEAVMSVPNELFYPVGVVTCIVVFTAHTPHNSNKYHKTWFGYWKDDGFIKTKHLGRIDTGKWNNIKEHWLETYHNRLEKDGESVLQKVTANDEWCAEAYMNTDYSNLTKEDFEEKIKQFVIFKIINNVE